MLQFISRWRRFASFSTALCSSLLRAIIQSREQWCIEALGKELLRLFRALIPDPTPNSCILPDLLTLVQSVIYNGHYQQRVSLPPMTAMTCIVPSLPISMFHLPHSTKSATTSNNTPDHALNIAIVYRSDRDCNSVLQTSS